ncbi:hypothetical protein HK098_007534 [Nowakowskiella sp. JEL0407]|nr:hypothetical protein HK098_007534 [Nowakowskiella sp. JEL0407]
MFPTIPDITTFPNGPTTHSNWVIPQRLIAGAYPGHKDDNPHKELIDSVLAAGVSTFVCVQTANELRHFNPYQPYAKSKKPNLEFILLPVVDHHVTADELLVNLAKDIIRRVNETDEVIYVHCWGGHGRTGSVISVVLGLYYGMSGEDAMDLCQKYHDLRDNPRGQTSPQSTLQKEQVIRILG